MSKFIGEAASKWSLDQKRLLQRWTSSATEVKSIEEAGKQARQSHSPEDIDAFLGRFTVLEKYYTRWEELTEQLLDLNVTVNAPAEAAAVAEAEFSMFPDAKQENALANVRKYYVDSLVYKAEVDRIQGKSVPGPPPSPLHNFTFMQDPGSVSANALPKMQIPKFDGQFINWVPFRDSFDSIVNQNAQLTPTQKFHYLIGALSGPAKSVISGFTLSDANYLPAYNALTAAFENKRVIASSHLNKILNFKVPSGRPTNEAYQQFMAQVVDSIAAIRLLQIPDELEFVYFHLASRALDAHTRQQFEFKLGVRDFPSIRQLSEFIRERQLAVHLSEQAVSTKVEDTKNIPSTSQARNKKPSGSKSSLLTQSQSSGRPRKSPEVARTSLVATDPQRRVPVTCVVCASKHGLYQCPKFNAMTPYDRFNALKNWSGCKLCFSYGHEQTACKQRTRPCRICDKAHHAMLCFTKAPKAEPADKGGNKESANSTLTGTTLNSIPIPSDAGETQVLLGTVKIGILDARGQIQTLRAVLDSGSQFSYITHRAMGRLGLTLTPAPRKISTLGGALFENAKGIVRGQVSGNSKIPDLSTEFVVVKSITSALPTFPVSDNIKKLYASYQLADSGWARPSECQVLIGNDLVPELITGAPITVGDGLPKVLPTIYGAVVVGKLTDHSKSPHVAGTSLFSTLLSQDNVLFDLQQFWESEEIPTVTESSGVPEDELAEELFKQGMYRLGNGQFGVKLPFRSPSPPDLSESKFLAKKRFLHLETKFRRNPELKRAYQDFMTEYIDLKHMEPTDEEPSYVLPHHAVFNKGKIRVVFDGSSGTQQGGINAHLLPGPPLQNDLRQILLRFRIFKVAFVTDVTKMYRSIELDPLHRRFQTILWRDDESLPLKVFQLNTVTYGLSSSPYQALRCMKQLADENAIQFPLAARAIREQSYVDDFLCGGPDIQAARQVQDELISVMARGQFKLSKWASNDPQILDAAASHGDVQSVDFSPSETRESPKVLGLKWGVRGDSLGFSIEPPEMTAVGTKRKLLSHVARTYDPIGLISPLTIKLKIVIQQLWLENLGWDEPIPRPLESQWRRFISEIGQMTNLVLPRRVTLDGPCKYQIIGFADASESAMCCAIYLRVQSESETLVHLLTSKTKVAPTRVKFTVPRLELTAAQMLSKLYSSLQPFLANLDGEIFDPVFFSDSMVTLAWIIKIPNNHLKIFVGNRVSEIRKLTPDLSCWRHVPGENNPADLGSRGLLPSQLIGNKFWFNGPDFLTLPQSHWPGAPEIPANFTVPELKTNLILSPVTLLACDSSFQLVDWMGRFSNYRTLLRVVARILRVIHNKRHPQTPRKGEFLLVEIVWAFKACALATQRYHFLKGNPDKFPDVQEKYRSLSPFLDDEGLIRVGGRIDHAPLPFAHRHPILLPPNAKFTLLFLRYYHYSYMHPAPSLLHALVQRRIWVPTARRLIRTISRKCVKCFSGRASQVFPLMGSLPEFRLSSSRAFLHVGLDFAGPFAHKTSLLRKAVITKMYFCVFVCMTTRAVHLEAVSDLSTPAFLASFERFIARRGLPSNVYSDNGSNFIGACRKLKEVYQWFHNQSTQEALTQATAEKGISWCFIPPYTPHFGGLWEAAVKSVKKFVRASIGDLPVTFECFCSLLASVEAMLNSRPLTPLSDDPSEYDVLTPGHFLIGCPLVSIPEPSVLDDRINYVDRWQVLRRARQQIWTRFRVEYLNTLQKRIKWNRQKPNVQIGDLVLLKNESSQPLNWPTARVIAVHPDPNDVCRVVDIRLPSGAEYRRSVANLVPLLPVNPSTRERDDVIPDDE